VAIIFEGKNILHSGKQLKPPICHDRMMIHARLTRSILKVGSLISISKIEFTGVRFDVSIIYIKTDMIRLTGLKQ
jgi:hypothetical protein